ncbi:MAG: UDP-glucose 4-epimerase GalE [Oscillospiraceae bacterium]|nr:UDP-glucose 4-epimerase GalE [Oscillospiraceae bacterium]
MKILVTGGMGYIGSHTCVELLNLGMEVVIADNLSNSNPEVLNRIETITGKRPVFCQLDVCDEAALSEVFAEHSIDCVIHFAGMKAVGESVAMPERYYTNNLVSTLTLCRVMAKYNVKKIIFSSSATVYSGDNQMPLQETSKTGNCTNPYGWTKYMGEQILRDIAFADKQWSVVLLRYFNPIGAHSSGLIGEDPKGIPNNLMPFVSQVAVGRREKLSVFGNDYDTHDGTGVRDYIHVVDLAKGHVAAIGYALEHTGSEVFNLGTGTGYSVLDMVKAFEKVNNVPVPYVIAPRRPGDLATCYADPAKSRELLRWTAERNLEDMCRDAWNWQKGNPNGYNG